MACSGSRKASKRRGGLECDDNELGLRGDCDCLGNRAQLFCEPMTMNEKEEEQREAEIQHHLYRAVVDERTGQAHGRCVYCGEEATLGTVDEPCKGRGSE